MPMGREWDWYGSGWERDHITGQCKGQRCSLHPHHPHPPPAAPMDGSPIPPSSQVQDHHHQHPPRGFGFPTSSNPPFIPLLLKRKGNSLGFPVLPPKSPYPTRTKPMGRLLPHHHHHEGAVGQRGPQPCGSPVCTQCELGSSCLNRGAWEEENPLMGTLPHRE